MAKLYNFRASGNPVDTDSSRKKGSRSKNFFHDDSSQLLSSQSPENGSIFYDGFIVHIYKDVQNCSTFNANVFFSKNAIALIKFQNKDDNTETVGNNV